MQELEWTVPLRKEIYILNAPNIKNIPCYKKISTKGIYRKFWMSQLPTVLVFYLQGILNVRDFSCSLMYNTISFSDVETRPS